MALDRREIVRIARLARLRLSPQELTRLEGEFDQILAYFDQIESVDTSGAAAEPGAGGTGHILREDQVIPGLSRTQALQNAPDTDGVHFRVPPVLPSSEP